MNASPLFVDRRFAERVERLALGLEPRDAIGGGRLPHPVWIDIEGPPPWIPAWRRQALGGRQLPSAGRTSSAAHAVRTDPRRPVIRRHDSGRHVLLYRAGLEDEVSLRIYERDRRYVPRRFRAPLLPLEEILRAEAEGRPLPAEPRIRRPWIFPGAAYDLTGRSTGLRGRVLRDGAPLRWARVEASLDQPEAEVLARAQGDDRGEFLLLLPPRAIGVSLLADPLLLRVTIYGPEQPPVPATPELPELDPYWDLPLEVWPPEENPQPVSAGSELPAGYTAGASRIVPFRLAHLVSARDGIADFVFDTA